MEFLSFCGDGGEDATLFLQRVNRIAFAEGKSRDNQWLTDYVAACLTGTALYWYAELDERVQTSWKDLRLAILKQFTIRGDKPDPPATTTLPPMNRGGPSSLLIDMEQARLPQQPLHSISPIKDRNHLPNMQTLFNGQRSSSYLPLSQVTRPSMSISPLPGTFQSLTPAVPNLEALSAQMHATNILRSDHHNQHGPGFRAPFSPGAQGFVPGGARKISPIMIKNPETMEEVVFRSPDRASIHDLAGRDRQCRKSESYGRSSDKADENPAFGSLPTFCSVNGAKRRSKIKMESPADKARREKEEWEAERMNQLEEEDAEVKKEEEAERKRVEEEKRIIDEVERVKKEGERGEETDRPENRKEEEEGAEVSAKAKAKEEERLFKEEEGKQHAKESEGADRRPDLIDTKQPGVQQALPSALTAARIIDDLGKVRYPEGIKMPDVELNWGAMQGGKFKYDRDFLLQFMVLCKERPDRLEPLDGLGIERTEASDMDLANPSKLARKGGGRRRKGPPGPLGSTEPPVSPTSISLGVSPSPGMAGVDPFASPSAGSGMDNIQAPIRGSSSWIDYRFAASTRAASAAGGRPQAVAITTDSGGDGESHVVAMGYALDGGPQSPTAAKGKTKKQRAKQRNDSTQPNQQATGASSASSSLNNVRVAESATSQGSMSSGNRARKSAWSRSSKKQPVSLVTESPEPPQAMPRKKLLLPKTVIIS
ncbi:hypothetical protein FRB96_008560 [Tulasnella sp. 330]|nr:hypothetical protein FRB96_008560 [Tulasnella sp. 330]